MDRRREQRRLRLLVIDDDRVVGEMVVTMLRHLGHETGYSSSGKDALRLFKSIHGTIDLVILDIVMPEFDGIKLLEQKINEAAP